MLHREKTVAEFEAEASRIRIVAKAKAEAESKRLQGQGIADEKRNCQRVSGKCRCTKQSWYQLKKHLPLLWLHSITIPYKLGAETILI
jgi:hypothetical protein